MFRRSDLEMRVLVIAPIGRDAQLLAATVRSLGLETVIAKDVDQLVVLLAQGAGSAIIADEVLSPQAMEALGTWLAGQPPWSDPPFIVLTSSGLSTQQSHSKARKLQSIGNFTLIERPLRPDTVESTLQAAMRARMRQYEIRSRQEALVQANADLEQFAHSASHDLREPLRSIAIYSELIERKYRDKLDQEGQTFLRGIHTSALRMDALLTDLLSYAHASSIGEEDLPAIPAGRPLETALKNLDGAIRESNAAITVGHLPDVPMRESHLSQIFQNLLGNAIKYRRDDAPLSIEVSAAQLDGFWVFTIADNGIGVAEPYQETIFGIFKRLHSDNKYAGTGMGLAICKRILERYQGRIWIESEPGQGSRFSFSIPCG
jgi:signal transduction histidine kinase